MPRRSNGSRTRWVAESGRVVVDLASRSTTRTTRDSGRGRTRRSSLSLRCGSTSPLCRGFAAKRCDETTHGGRTRGSTTPLSVPAGCFPSPHRSADLARRRYVLAAWHALHARFGHHALVSWRWLIGVRGQPQEPKIAWWRLGVVLIARWPRRSRWDPAAGVVQGPVGRGHHVEGVHHQLGVVEPSLVLASRAVDDLVAPCFGLG